MLISEFTRRARRMNAAQRRAFLLMTGFGFTPHLPADFTSKVKELELMQRQFDKDPDAAVVKLKAVVNPQSVASAETRELQDRLNRAHGSLNDAIEASNKIPMLAEEAAKTAVGSLLEGAMDKIATVESGAKDALVAECSRVLSEVTDIDAVTKMVAEQASARVEEIISERINSVREVEVKVGRNRVRRLKQSVTHPEFERVLQLAANGVHVLLVGPAGCGKSHLTRMVAKALDYEKEEYASVSCSMGMSESQITGRLLPTGKYGAFEYHASPFITCYEEGGLMVFDEIDAADPNTLVTIHTALADKSGFSLPTRFEDPFVERHEDFRCIACANTYGLGADQLYVGRAQLDAATLDRFRVGMVTMDYSESIERHITQSHPWVYDHCISIRKKIREKGLKRIMSTRVMEDATKMAKVGWGPEQFNEAYFADWTHDEKRRFEV